MNGGYIRPALDRGLEIAQSVGVNPFELGLVGSSDVHTGLVNSDEKLAPGNLDNPPDVQQLLGSIRVQRHRRQGRHRGHHRRLGRVQHARVDLRGTISPRDLCHLGHSPARATVRGLRYPSGLTKQRNWVKQAYDTGVAMGSDVSGSKANGKPLRILMQAVKDPDAGNLDRIQIVKVWLEDGKAKERIFDVAWAGNRAADAKGAAGHRQLGERGTATYTNDIGANELIADWQDPTFRADQTAVYYARVLEIPTPRWSTYLAVQNKLPVPTSVPSTIQERAWTSPIYYRP